jgi:putative transposase
MKERFIKGGLVRLHGRPYVVDGYIDGYWHFSPHDPSDKHATVAKFTPVVVRTLARQMKLTSEGVHRALSSNVREALTWDWGSFSTTEQMSAYKKYPFVKAIDDLPVDYRDKTKVVAALIKSTNATATDPFKKDELPNKRRVLGWYLRWLSAGRDIRALVDFHSKKGYRKKGLQDWELEEINRAIDELYNADIRGSERATWRRARDLILLRADRDGLTLNAGKTRTGKTHAKEVLGKNAIARVLGKRDKYPLIANRFTKWDADMKIRNLGVGPSGDYSLDECEVDHTPLDLIIRDEKTGALLGKPYLTAIIDRYSRIICGFNLSFAPPSWVSVMGALRMAVLPKERFLKSVGGGFEFTWDVYGVMSRLFCDNGPEFRSESMRATEAVLNFKVIDVPRCRGDLKGKIESWFKTQTKKLTHLLPGTTRSNVQDRADYDSEGNAILTLPAAMRIITIYVVDIYNQERHSATDEIPAERYLRGLEIGGQPLPPSEDLIAPMTGLVVRRTLQRSGVRYNRLRWNSNAFTALLNRVGPGANVMIRIDPLDLRVAYVLDEETGEWVEGDLLSETEVEKYTLAQYEHIRSELGALTVYDEQRGLKIARAAQRIRDIVAEHAKSSKVVNRRDARFVTEGRKPAEHIHQSRLDPDESERLLSGHVFSQDGPKSAPPDARGPHRERVLPTPKFEPQFPPQIPHCPTSPPATPDGGPSPAAVSQRALTGRRRPTSGKADV